MSRAFDRSDSIHLDPSGARTVSKNTPPSEQQHSSTYPSSTSASSSSSPTTSSTGRLNCVNKEEKNTISKRDQKFEILLNQANALAVDGEKEASKMQRAQVSAARKSNDAARVEQKRSNNEIESSKSDNNNMLCSQRLEKRDAKTAGDFDQGGRDHDVISVKDDLRHEREQSLEAHPLDLASPLSRLMFGWMVQFVWRAWQNKNGLEPGDMPKRPTNEEQSASIGSNLERIWDEETEKSKRGSDGDAGGASLKRVLFRAHARWLFLASLVSLFAELFCKTLSAYSVGQMLHFLAMRGLEVTSESAAQEFNNVLLEPGSTTTTIPWPTTTTTLNSSWALFSEAAQTLNDAPGAHMTAPAASYSTSLYNLYKCRAGQEQQASNDINYFFAQSNWLASFVDYSGSGSDWSESDATWQRQAANRLGGLEMVQPDRAQANEALFKWTIILICSSFAWALSAHFYGFQMMRLALHVRLGCSHLIYAKALRLPIGAVRGHSDRQRKLAHEQQKRKLGSKVEPTSSAGKGESSVFNLMSNDLDKFNLVFIFLPFAYVGPLQMLATLYLLWPQLGVVCLAPLSAVCLLVVPGQLYLSGLFARARARITRLADRRLELLAETISSLRLIKLYAWERARQSKLDQARAQETNQINRVALTRGVSGALMFISNKLLMFVTLFFHCFLLGRPLEPKTLFLSMALLNNVQYTMSQLIPRLLILSADCLVSVKRIEQFLHANERPTIQASLLYEPYTVGSGEATISIECLNLTLSPMRDNRVEARKHEHGSDASAGDAVTQSSVLVRDLTFKCERTIIKHGQQASATTDQQPDKQGSNLTLVCGVSGAGKSSLLLGLLNELQIASGHARIRYPICHPQKQSYAGSNHSPHIPDTRPLPHPPQIAYCSQEAWLFDGTIRENIVFGRRFEPDHYDRVVWACALGRDLELLGGDRVYIQASSLSGGQKARVNLARCLYGRSDIYLLDDPLAALDSRVAKHIIEFAFGQLLANKMVILVNHNRLCDLLPKTRELLVLGAAGQTLAFGTLPNNPDECQSGTIQVLEQLEQSSTMIRNNDDNEGENLRAIYEHCKQEVERRKRGQEEGDSDRQLLIGGTDDAVGKPDVQMPESGLASYRATIGRGLSTLSGGGSSSYDGDNELKPARNGVPLFAGAGGQMLANSSINVSHEQARDVQMAGNAATVISNMTRLQDGDGQQLKGARNDQDCLQVGASRHEDALEANSDYGPVSSHNICHHLMAGNCKSEHDEPTQLRISSLFNSRQTNNQRSNAINVNYTSMVNHHKDEATHDGRDPCSVDQILSHQNKQEEQQRVDGPEIECIGKRVSFARIWFQYYTLGSRHCQFALIIVTFLLTQLLYSSVDVYLTVWSSVEQNKALFEQITHGNAIQAILLKQQDQQHDYLHYDGQTNRPSSPNRTDLNGDHDIMEQLQPASTQTTINGNGNLATLVALDNPRASISGSILKSPRPQQAAKLIKYDLPSDHQNERRLLSDGGAVYANFSQNVNRDQIGQQTNEGDDEQHLTNIDISPSSARTNHESRMRARRNSDNSYYGGYEHGNNLVQNQMIAPNHVVHTSGTDVMFTREKQKNLKFLLEQTTLTSNWNHFDNDHEKAAHESVIPKYSIDFDDQQVSNIELNPSDDEQQRPKVHNLELDGDRLSRITNSEIGDNNNLEDVISIGDIAMENDNDNNVSNGCSIVNGLANDTIDTDDYHQSSAILDPNITLESEQLLNVNPLYRPMYKLVENFSPLKHTLTYGSLLCLVCLTSALANIQSHLSSNMAGKILYKKLTDSALFAKIAFFDRTPHGRFINRASRDIAVIDELIPYNANQAYEILLQTMGTFAIVILVQAQLALPSICLFSLYLIVYKLHVLAAKDIHRYEGILRSPIISHIGSTMAGLTTIRSSSCQLHQMNLFRQHQDSHSSVFLLYLGSNRLIAVTLDCFNSCYLAIIAFWVICQTSDTISGPSAGLVITSTMLLSGLTQHGLMKLAETESLMTSVERVIEYCKLPQEEQKEDQHEAKKKKEALFRRNKNSSDHTNKKTNNNFNFACTDNNFAIGQPSLQNKQTQTNNTELQDGHESHGNRLNINDVNYGEAHRNDTNSTYSAGVYDCNDGVWPRMGQLEYKQVHLCYTDNIKNENNNDNYQVHTNSGDFLNKTKTTNAIKNCLKKFTNFATSLVTNSDNESGIKQATSTCYSSNFEKQLKYTSNNSINCDSNYHHCDHDRASSINCGRLVAVRTEDKHEQNEQHPYHHLQQPSITGSLLTNSKSTKWVLKNITFKLDGGEKVGVIGRTGAGKSSIITTLFRLYDFEGSIEIDGRNINNLDLFRLRSSIGIIPQQPILFSGSMRENLDPFGQYEDSHIWLALDKAHLRELVSALPGKLDYCIIGSDSTKQQFSTGQKQLISLARVLLKQSKLVVLDEATANVDPNTDSLIQATIRREFKHATVLTIAHRLETILDSDRIMILDSGRIIDFDTPERLMAKGNNYFSELMRKNKQHQTEEESNGPMAVHER